MLVVSLFGKPTLRLNALEVSLSTRKALGLVGYLALEGATSRAKLADLLWGELDDSAARTNLRQELRRIRATKLEGCLLVEGDQLKLKAPLETDVTKFQNAINAEQFEAALEYCQGVFLEGTEWRGAPGFEEWVESWRETLSSQRRTALKRQAVALESAGNPRGALAAHLALLEDDELQEHHHREAMRLHSMLNERQEALARFERCRQILKQELGLDPLPETIRLAERIRSGRNSSLKPSKTAPAENPFQTPPMIGRDQLWTQLETSEASLILIEGEPGVGKTRLATEFAQASGNTLVLNGQELSSGTPLFPVASALRARLTTQNLALETIWRHEAARLVPELEPDAPSAASEALPEGRARFLEGLTHALIAAVQQSGTLLLDDFHWFDATSSELMVQLSKRAKTAGIKLIATARPSELSENLAATRAIQHLEQGGLLTRLPLEPLNEPMILSLLQAISGSTGGTVFAKRLFDATAGNPLFVLETLRDLLEAGTLFKDSSGLWRTPYDQDTQDYSELPLAQSVRQAVLQRIDRLGPAVRRMLDAASLTGDDFQLSELTQATALDEWLGLEALERASSAGILRSDQQGHRFHHDLIRRSLSNALSADRRKLLHKRLAATLESTHGQPARIADHLEQADLKTQAAPWRIKAAEAARTMYAYRDALAHYARALENGVSQHEQFRIHTARAALWKALDERIGWGEDVHAAIEIAMYLGERNLEIESGLGLAEFYFYSGQYHKALEAATEILEQQDVPNEWLTRAHLEAGNALIRLGRAKEAENHFQKGLEYVSSNAHETIGRLHHALSVVQVERNGFAVAHINNQIALSAFQKVGNRTWEATAMRLSGQLASQADDSEKARIIFIKAFEIAQKIGNVALQRSILLHLSGLYLVAEEGELALPQLLNGLALVQEPQDPYIEAVFLSQLSIAYRLCGDLGASLKTVRKSLEISDKISLSDLQATQRIELARILMSCGDLLSSKFILKEAKQIIKNTNLDYLFIWLEANIAWWELEKNNSVKLLEKIQKTKILNEDIVVKTMVNYLISSSKLIKKEYYNLDLDFSKMNSPPSGQAMFFCIFLKVKILTNTLIENDLKSIHQLINSNRIPPLEKLELLWIFAESLGNIGKLTDKIRIRKKAEDLSLKLALSLPIELRGGFIKRQSKLSDYSISKTI